MRDDYKTGGFGVGCHGHTRDNSVVVATTIEGGTKGLICHCKVIRPDASIEELPYNENGECLTDNNLDVVSKHPLKVDKKQQHVNDDGVLSRIIMKLDDAEDGQHKFRCQLQRIQRMLYSVGGPLNDNHYQYNENQLKIFMKINSIIEGE